MLVFLSKSKGGEMEADQVLDCRGMHCPLPIVKTKKMLDTMQSGQILRVESTDKGAVSDMPAFSKRTGHEILESKEEDGVLIFYLKKK
jgi:tRNA 2-thiouridine synthesizing protein A